MASTTRIPLIAGNWKMHKTIDEAKALVGQIVEALGSSEGFEIGLFPPATALAAVVDAVSNSSRSALVGAQNMHDEAQGAFTGETSAGMIVGCGATSVILGHSERRHVFGENDEFIGRKVNAALAAGLTPILCIGETIEEREAGSTTAVCDRQLQSGIAGVETPEDLAKIIIAYEPVWAIGTGLTATPQQAQEVHAFVRGALAGAFDARGGSSAQGAGGAEGVRILYGGSVKPENAAELLSEPDIDGALVGGASLNAGSFAGICQGSQG